MFFKKRKSKIPPRPPESPARAKQDDTPGLVKGIFMAYGIVVLHLSLIAMALLMVLIVNGVVNHFFWLVVGGAAMIGGGFWFFMKKITAERQALRNILQLPEFKGKTVEISLLGGVASLKLGDRSDKAMDIEAVTASSTPLLGNVVRSRLDGLGELSRLYENGMITEEERDQLKQELMTAADEPAA